MPEIDVQLLDVNEYSRPGIESDPITGVVIHYTANPGSTAQENRDYFNGLQDGHDTSVSSHFVVGLDGEIIQCVPTWEIAYASNERNHDTVSIECCHPDETGEFTEETYASVVQLTAFLCRKYDLTADAVIRQEDTDYGEEKVHIFKPVNPYDNYCFQGEDYKAGACLVHKGERMDAANTALAASMGYDSVAVFREPRIAIIATGDELRMPGEDLEAGQIYTSNQFLLAGRLKELGITQLTVRKAPDAPAKVAACIRELAGSHDLIITSGGVSVGKKDIMHDVAENLGCRKLFWRIRFKPGSPAMAFMYDSTCVLCLSGNPFGAGAGMELLVRPALSYLTGDAGFLAKEESAVMSEDFPKPSKMRRFLRAVLTGEEVRLSKGLASSGVLSTLKDCNCIIDIPAGSPGLKRGEEVCVRIL